ncbi:MAG: phospholipase, partial [Cytophagia bacterium]|nr:phospholipase [Cytophagia bacterium]
MQKKVIIISLVFLLLMFRCTIETHSQPNLISGSITVDHLNRTYLANVPANRADNSLALVIVLHGGGGSAAQCERSYGWTAKSAAEQFMVVYPDGVASNKPLKLRTWNAGRCCDYASQMNIDDVKFLSELIDHLSSRYPINRKSVFVTGMSNGAMMAYRLACEIPEKITAIAAVSGTLMTTQPCQPSRATPILHIHSELDTRVPLAGGTGIFNYTFSSV